MDGRWSPTDAGPLGMSSAVVSRAMSSTGTSIVSFRAFLRPASTTVTGRYRKRPARCCELAAGLRSGLPPFRSRFGGRVRLIGDLPAEAVRSVPPRNRATSSSGRCVAERPIRWRALPGARADRGEPFDGEREVRAAFGRHERVDLVDDDRVDRAKGFARVRREQQVQRLGRRDQDVRRLAPEARPLGLRRVARADRNSRRQVGVAARVRHLRDAGERRPQIALDIGRQRLQGRDVQDPAPGRFRRRGREHQAIEAPQKCRQGLAAAGRGEDERGVAARDCGPSERLRPGWVRRKPPKTTREPRDEMARGAQPRRDLIM